jgi:uncharacterized membrane protein YjfL (UPF0719 family)
MRNVGFEIAMNQKTTAYLHYQRAAFLRRAMDLLAGLLVGISFGLAIAIVTEEKSHWLSTRNPLAIGVAIAFQLLGLAILLAGNIKRKKSNTTVHHIA